MTADHLPLSFEARWASEFPRPTLTRPVPPEFSPWHAHDRVLTEVRRDRALTQRVLAAYGACQRAQGEAGRASRAQRPVLMEDARAHFYAACTLIQPLVARHFDPAFWRSGWPEAQSVVTALGHAQASGR